MREHHRCDARRGNVPQRQVLPRAGSDIHQVDAAAGEDRGARSRAFAIGQRIPVPHNTTRIESGSSRSLRVASRVCAINAAKNRILHRRHMNHPPHNRSKRRKSGSRQNQSSQKFCHPDGRINCVRGPYLLLDPHTRRAMATCSLRLALALALRRGAPSSDATRAGSECP